MKGFFTPYGYMGYVDGKWMLFANERDYFEYFVSNSENITESDYIFERTIKNHI